MPVLSARSFLLLPLGLLHLSERIVHLLLLALDHRVAHRIVFVQLVHEPLQLDLLWEHGSIVVRLAVCVALPPLAPIVVCVISGVEIELSHRVVPHVLIFLRLVSRVIDSKHAVHDC